MPCLAKRRAGDECSGNEIGVAVEIFRRSVHDDIGTERQRLSEHGRGDSRIDRQQRAGLMSDVSGGGDVGDMPERI